MCICLQIISGLATQSESPKYAPITLPEIIKQNKDEEEEETQEEVKVEEEEKEEKQFYKH